MIRTLHNMERHYLAADAQRMVYIYLACPDVPNEIVEKAINEAIAYGRSCHKPVDAEVISTFVDAFFIDKLYGVSGSMRHGDLKSNWTC